MTEAQGSKRGEPELMIVPVHGLKHLFLNPESNLCQEYAAHLYQRKVVAHLMDESIKYVELYEPEEKRAHVASLLKRIKQAGDFRTHGDTAPCDWPCKEHYDDAEPVNLPWLKSQVVLRVHRCMSDLGGNSNYPETQQVEDAIRASGIPCLREARYQGISFQFGREVIGEESVCLWRTKPGAKVVAWPPSYERIRCELCGAHYVDSSGEILNQFEMYRGWSGRYQGIGVVWCGAPDCRKRLERGPQWDQEIQRRWQARRELERATRKQLFAEKKRLREEMEPWRRGLKMLGACRRLLSGNHDASPSPRKASELARSSKRS